MAKSATRYGDKKRLSVVILLFVVATLIIVARLFYLHVIDAKHLRLEGDARALRISTEDARRGIIYDRRDEELAISTPISAVVADPLILLRTLYGDFYREKDDCLNPNNFNKKAICQWINNKKEPIKKLNARYQTMRLTPLADAIGLDVPYLIKRLNKYKTNRFLYLAKNLAPKTVDNILKLKIPGIRRENGYQRYYPAGELTAQIIGYTGYDQNGQEGIEKKYNNLLSGKDGEYELLKDAGGDIIKVVDEIAPVAPGENLRLSIDKRIQLIMYKTLKETRNKFKAKSVSGVMMDIKTGEILGMISLPSGNPNNGAERIPELMKNRVVTDMFEPGSTIKPIAMSAVLTAGVITKNTKFDTHGVYKIGKNIVRDTHNYGVLDSVGVIRKSSNIGMSMISQRMPRDQYYKFLSNMGLGKETAVHFVGEASGVLKNPEKMGDFSYATTFFGYGLDVTSLQLASAYAAIANHGVKVPLTLFKRYNPAQGTQVIPPKVADEVLDMMAQVVETGGTGGKANTGSYTVAGKTGTAHLVTNGKYDKDRYRGLFAGVAPANDPKIALVIVVEDPSTKSYYGGTVAAPAFSEIVEWSLKLLGVLPDKINKTNSFKLDIKKEPKPVLPKLLPIP